MQDVFSRLGPALGSGGNGEVSQLHAWALPGAAVKSSSDELCLQHEAEVMSDIQHPNVLPGYGLLLGPALADGSRPLYLAMERLHQSLQTRLYSRTK